MFWTTDFFICLLLLLAIGVISFVLNRRRLELFSLAVFALTALAALLALRNVPIFALLAVPLVAINIQQACNHKLQTTNLKLRSAIGCLLSAVLLVLNVLVFFRGAHVANDYRRPGFGYDRRIFPNGAADFVLRNKVPGHIFSTMEYGGYFIWMWYPEHQVYIDGRLDVYGSDLFETYGKVFWSAPILDSVVERYDLNCFVLPQPPSNTAPTRSYIGRTLALRSDWSLVYFDDLALVYLRDVPRNRKLIDRFAYRALVPSLLGLPEEGPDPEQNLQEARRAVAANPESPLAQTMLGVTLSQAGEFDSAGRAFDHALKLDPRYGDALLGLGILYARRQRPDTAIAVLERLVRLEPSNGFARLNLALVCMQDETWGYAQQQLLKAIELNPELVAAYGLLGDIYFRHEMYDMAGRIWRDALRVSPEDPTILRRLEQLEGR
jgi:tetratricopeptide (TPR) repeat protein